MKIKHTQKLKECKIYNQSSDFTFPVFISDDNRNRIICSKNSSDLHGAKRGVESLCYIDFFHHHVKHVNCLIRLYNLHFKYEQKKNY